MSRDTIVKTVTTHFLSIPLERSLITHQPWWQAIMEQPLGLVNGCIQLSDRPGCGFAV